MHEGGCEQEIKFQTECILTRNPLRLVWIKVIAWDFRFSSLNVDILHLRHMDMVSYFHCFVTWCTWTTGGVASQCPSPRDISLVTRHLTHSISACMNPLKRILLQYKILTMNLQTQLKIAMLRLTLMISGISHTRCQWFSVWRHELVFVTHEIT